MLGDESSTQPSPLKEEGLSRRAILGGGVAAIGLMASRVEAHQPVQPPEVVAPSGVYWGYRRYFPEDYLTNPEVYLWNKALGYTGIRYGIAKRFERAVPPPDTNEVANYVPSSEPGIVARPMVANASPQRGAHYSPQSEDCLFLNVFNRWVRPSDRKPVMVYLFFMFT